MTHPLINEAHQLKVLTQTALRTYRKCQTLYHNSYVELYKPRVVSEPLKFGDVWHQIREIWWNPEEYVNKNPQWDVVNGVTPELRLAAGLDKLAEIHKNPEIELDDFVVAKLMVMFRGYHERWHKWIDSVKVLGVEVPFEIPLTNPVSFRNSRTFIVRGVLDAIIQDSDGKVWVVEEKTASGDLTPESPYWRRLEIDPQCSLYYHAVTKTLGIEPSGVEYFVNVKPNARPLKKTSNPKYKKDTGELYKGQRAEDETASEYAVRMAELMSKEPEAYFQRVQVARLAKDIFESSVDIWNTAKAIRESEVSGIWLRNPDACIHPYGSTCSFFPVCTNRASLDDQSMFRKAEVPHEELSK